MLLFLYIFKRLQILWRKNYLSLDYFNHFGRYIKVIYNRDNNFDD